MEEEIQGKIEVTFSLIVLSVSGIGKYSTGDLEWCKIETKYKYTSFNATLHLRSSQNY